MRDDQVCREVEATVVGRWHDASQQVLIKPIDGPAFEAAAPPAIAPYLSRGARVIVSYGNDGERLGWLLPEKNIGVREDSPGSS